MDIPIHKPNKIKLEEAVGAEKCYIAAAAQDMCWQRHSVTLQSTVASEMHQREPKVYGYLWGEGSVLRI